MVGKLLGDGGQQTLLEKYSEFGKMLRITAYCFRFLRRCRNSWNPAGTPPEKCPIRKIFLTATGFPKRGQKNVMELLQNVETPDRDDMEEANMFCIRHAQITDYREEVRQLISGDELNNKSPLLPLQPYWDDDNVLRVGAD